MGAALKLPLWGRRQEERREKPRRQAPAERKRPTKGATRRAAPAANKAPRDFAWVNRLMILVAVAVVIGAGLKTWITLQEIPVQHITITGDLVHTDAQAIENMVQPALAGGFLQADLAQVRRRLEALPWVYQANVRRRWPDALDVHLVEQLPIARWGEAALINHEGQVFRPSDVASGGALPLLRGPSDAAEPLMGLYLRLRDLLAPLGLAVQELVVDERGQVEAELDGGIQLVLGADDFRDRMRRFIGLYQSQLAQRAGEVEQVDMRYASGAAVRFAPPQEPAEPAQGT